MRNLLIAWLLLVVLLGAQAQSPAIPDLGALKELTADSMEAFSNAVATKDFTAFHKQISALWREQITPAKLKSIFATFIEQEIDLTPALQLTPQFAQPASLDEDGVLVIHGHYDTRPSAVQFRLKYVNERSTWKLVGLKVDVKPARALPDQGEARALALESLLAFNRAVQAKNFAAFHKQIAEVWRKQITPAELQKAFAPFVEQGVNIATVADLQPVFDPAPGFDEDDFLLLKGYYPTQPNKVYFKLRYLREDDTWQLVNIAVNVSPEANADADTRAEVSDRN